MGTLFETVKLLSCQKNLRKQMDQDPGLAVAQGNEFTIGRSLTIMLSRAKSRNNPQASH